MQILAPKLDNIAATRAEVVVAPNPGCMLQLRYGSERYGPALKVYHLMDLLDRAYASADASDLK